MPKKITAAMVTKVCERSAEYTQSPEAKLWLAVLGNYFNDYEHAHEMKPVVLSYVHTADFRKICDWLGLNSENVAKLVQRIGEPIHA